MPNPTATTGIPTGPLDHIQHPVTSILHPTVSVETVNLFAGGSFHG